MPDSSHPPADTRRALGQFGERLAAAHLIARGLTLICHGWRHGRGELDLVMRDGDEWVFVEVRTRRGAAAIESITPRKRAHLRQLAYAYLEAAHVPPSTAWRIDIVAIDLDRQGRVQHLEHLPAAVGEE